MPARIDFPSRAFFDAAAAALQGDPGIQAMLADLGPMALGINISRGDEPDGALCALARLAPGRPIDLSYPDDEDELDELAPDAIAALTATTARELFDDALAGRTPDVLRALAAGRIKVSGDLPRLLRVLPRHPQAGVATLRRVAASLSSR